MASTRTKRIWWAKWVCQKQGPFPWINVLGKKTRVNPLTVDAWSALSMVLSTYGYVPSQSIWNYNCRPITAGTGYSLHAYGIATDIDPTANPYFGRGHYWSTRFSWDKTAFTKEQIDAVYRIKSTSGRRLFLWGGYWNTVKDYMHFEIDVPPDNVKVDWTTVDGGDEMGPGDKGLGVTRYQQLLLRWDANCLPTYGADGDYGGETTTAVKEFQDTHGLTVTGRIGEATGGLLASYGAGQSGPPGPPGPPGKTPTVLHATQWK